MIDSASGQRELAGISGPAGFYIINDEDDCPKPATSSLQFPLLLQSRGEGVT